MRISTDAAVEAVTRYVSGGYTGAAFDLYGRNEVNDITSDDLIAVTMLSIQITQHSTSAITPSAILKLTNVRSQIALLLAQLPADRDLHSLTEDQFNAWMGPGSPGDALYGLIRRRVQLPRVAAHKLLARKRPRLLPIRDSVVDKELSTASSPQWWRPWWETVSSDDEIAARLADIRHHGSVGYLSLLRVADIVVWMHGTSNDRPGNVTGYLDDSSGEP